MIDQNIEIEDVVDELLEKGINANDMASAVNLIGLEASPKLLARIADKIEERRLEKESALRPTDIRHLKGKMDSIYQNELHKRKSKTVNSDVLERLRIPASWKAYVSVFGGDFSFVMKLAQRTLEPPFPKSFVQFLADLWGVTFLAMEEYLADSVGVIQAEYSSRTKPKAPQKENFTDALERSTIPMHLKQEWLEDVLRLKD